MPLLLGLGLIFAWWAQPLQEAVPWSNFVLIDGAWRIQQGQVAHVDFHSPIGFGYLHLLAAVGNQCGLGPALPLRVAGLLLPLLLGVALLALWRRAPLVLSGAALVLVTVLTLSIAPFGQHEAPVNTFTGHYNRLGWAVLAVLALLAQAWLLRRDSESRLRPLVEAALGGLLLALAWAIKFTYAAVGSGLLGAALLALVLTGAPRWPLLRQGAVLATAAVVTALLLHLGTGTPIGAYLSDIAGVADSAAVPLPRLLAGQLLRSDAVAAVPLLALAAYAAALLSRQARSWPRMLFLAVLALGFLAISASNGVERISPGFALLALVAVAFVGAEPTAPRWLMMAALVLLTAQLVRFSHPLLRCVMEGPATVASSPVPLDIPMQAGLDRGNDGGDRGLAHDPAVGVRRAYREHILDGHALLAAQGGSQLRILNFDICNPWPSLLGAPPPRHDLILWTFGRNVAETTAPANLLDGCDAVMVPKQPVRTGALEWKQRIYGAGLQRDFAVQAESTHWRLYRRRTID